MPEINDNKRVKTETKVQGPERYVSDKKANFHNWIIPTSAILTGTLVTLAAPELVDASGIIGGFKIALIGTSAAFVSGVVNYYAIKVGTELAGRGFKLAAIASLAPVLIVGGSAAVFSYSGLVLKQVNELNLQEHGQRLSDYVEVVNAHTAQIFQIRPLIETAAKDIQRNLDCEKRIGCLSNGKGGEGTIYRAVLPLASRAAEISAQLDSSETFRKSRLAAANDLVGKYQSLLSDQALSTNERQQLLSKTDARIKQEVSDLRESVPVSLFTSYGNELSNGISISGKPGSTTKVNALLRRHGTSITSAIDGLKSDKSNSPDFPTKAGVAQGFERFSRFWPIGILTIAIEMLIPIMLWVFTYVSMVWRLYKSENSRHMELNTAGVRGKEEAHPNNKRPNHNQKRSNRRSLKNHRNGLNGGASHAD